MVFSPKCRTWSSTEIQDPGWRELRQPPTNLEEQATLRTNTGERKQETGRTHTNKATWSNSTKRKEATSNLSEDAVARGVDGGHTGGHIGHGLVLPIPKTDVPISRLDLPARGTMVDRAIGVVDEIPGGGGDQLEVGVLDAAEGLREEQHLPVHVGLLRLCFEFDKDLK